MLVAQQPNSQQAALVLDGQGGVVWPVAITVRNATTSSIAISGGANRPFALWASADGLVHAASAATSGGIVDLSLSASPVEVFNGFSNPSAFNTGVTATWSIPVSIPSSVAVSSQHAFQAVVANPSAAAGWTLSGATQVSVTQGPITTPLSLGDDGVLPISLPIGMAIPFFGVNHTVMYVCANGFATLTWPDSDFTPSSQEFNYGAPRLAPFWTDLAQGSGTIQAVVDASPPSGIPTVRVEWINVPDFGGSGFTHTFAVEIDVQGLVTMSWPISNFASIYSTLIGIGPGLGLNFAPMKDLSALVPSAPLGAVNESFHEWFGLASMPAYLPQVNRPYDLAGASLHFLPSGGGATWTTVTSRYVMY